MRPFLAVRSCLALIWAAAMVSTPVFSKAATVLDPTGNLRGDASRRFMDIVEAGIQSVGTDLILEVQMSAPFPAAGDMAGGKRFDVMWFIDIDRNRATGQSAEGNDYNVHIFLDETGWQYWWFKVSSLSQADGIANLPSEFKIDVSGDQASLTFPQAYLPSRSFEMWAMCSSGNAPEWEPYTENSQTARTVFEWGFHFAQPAWTVDVSAGQAVLTVLREDDSPERATVDYATEDGTAKAGLDYTAVAGTLVFPHGLKSATLSVPILEDGVAEGNEQLTVRLSNPVGRTALGQTPSTLVIITDNEPWPTDLWYSYAPDGTIWILGYKGSSGVVTIPGTINGRRVGGIAAGAFLGFANVTAITIPDSVTTIMTGAFQGCTGLTSVTIPNSVTSVGDRVFIGCTSLTNVTIGGGVTKIGQEAFSGCTSLTSVTIPNSVTSVGDRAFIDCTSLTNVTIGSGVTKIGEEVFSGCTGLTSVTIRNSVIGDHQFAGCRVGAGLAPDAPHRPVREVFPHTVRQ